MSGFICNNHFNHSQIILTRHDDENYYYVSINNPLNPCFSYPAWLLAADLKRAMRLSSDPSESIGLGCFILSSYILAAKALAVEVHKMPSEFMLLIGPLREWWPELLLCNWALCCISCSCCICSCCWCSLAFICCACKVIVEQKLVRGPLVLFYLLVLTNDSSSTPLYPPCK